MIFTNCVFLPFYSALLALLDFFLSFPPLVETSCPKTFEIRFPLILGINCVNVSQHKCPDRARLSIFISVPQRSTVLSKYISMTLDCKRLKVTGCGKDKGTTEKSTSCSRRRRRWWEEAKGVHSVSFQLWKMIACFCFCFFDLHLL